MWMQKEIKLKIIQEYKNYLKGLFVGKNYDYQHILDMINFVEVSEYTKNPEIIKSYFLHK